MKTHLLLIVCLIWLSSCSAIKCRKTPQEESKLTKNDAAEIVPKSLDEAHLELERLLPNREIARIDAMKSEDEINCYHLGLWIRNCWGLWGGSPLATHMRRHGFTHADDMSGVILETFWCKRHGKAFRLQERADYFEAGWLARAAPPWYAIDLRNLSTVDWDRNIPDREPKSPGRIWFGKSRKTGRLLAYERSKGVYVPDVEMMKYFASFEWNDQSLK